MQIGLNPFLYYVTPSIGKDVVHWLTLAKEAVLGGASVVQIRDKENSVRTIVAAATALQPFLNAHKAALIINDHVDIAHAVGADGVHLGLSDLSVDEARNILGPDAIIGLSLEELSHLPLANGADYVAASPLFPTRTKKDAAPPWGLEGLSTLRKATTLPIVVIGGIQAHHIPKILHCGANGIAVVSAIAEAICPRQAARELCNKLNI